jgi:hypothetical protein
LKDQTVVSGQTTSGGSFQESCGQGQNGRIAEIYNMIAWNNARRAELAGDSSLSEPNEVN